MWWWWLLGDSRSGYQLKRYHLAALNITRIESVRYYHWPNFRKNPGKLKSILIHIFIQTIKSQGGGWYADHDSGISAFVLVEPEPDYNYATIIWWSWSSTCESRTSFRTSSAWLCTVWCKLVGRNQQILTDDWQPVLIRPSHGDHRFQPPPTTTWVHSVDALQHCSTAVLMILLTGPCQGLQSISIFLPKCPIFSIEAYCSIDSWLMLFLNDPRY